MECIQLRVLFKKGNRILYSEEALIDISKDAGVADFIEKVDV